MRCRSGSRDVRSVLERKGDLAAILTSLAPTTCFLSMKSTG